MSATTLLLTLAVAAGQPGPAPDKQDKEKEKAPPVGAFRLRHLGPAVTSGGVWKTTNAGTTWQPVFDNEGSYSIGYVALDPKNPNVVWVGTGENNSQRSVAYGDGVYKSTDGGRSWAHVGLKYSEHIG